MADKSKLKPIASALGVTLVATLAASPVVKADENPFAISEISGYMTAGDHKEGKCGEGKCGEGKCGGEKGKEGKCGEGKCGGEKGKEGKCGEGKCGGDKK